MNNILIFVYESGICLAILFSFYWLFLRRETYFQFNRFYLVSIAVISCLIPLGNFSFSLFDTDVSSSTIIPNMVEAITITEWNTVEGVNHTSDSLINVQFVAAAIYLIGVLFLMLRIVLGIVKVSQLKRKGHKTFQNGYSVVHIKNDLAHFSFFKTVYINDALLNSPDGNSVLRHELIHIRQKHSYDKLFVEIFLAIFWYNPFMWLLKSALRDTHEYQADHGVIHQTSNITDYQSLLLKQFKSLLPIVVTHSFNSTIKNRIKMMSRKKSSILAKIKPLLVIPVLICLTLLFACSENTNNVANEIKTPESVKEAPVVIDKELKEIQIDSSNAADSNDQEVVELIADKSDKSRQMKDFHDSINNQFNTDSIKEILVEKREIFTIAQEMPTFNNGDPSEEFPKFIAQNLKYPDSAKSDGISGIVEVQFVINKEGSVVDAMVIESVSPLLDEEALRVVMSSPKWTTGKQLGKIVEVLYKFPIQFVLE